MKYQRHGVKTTKPQYTPYVHSYGDTINKWTISKLDLSELENNNATRIIPEKLHDAILFGNI